MQILLKTFSPKGNSRHCRKKRENTKKSPIFFLTRCCHGNDLQKVNNNTNMIVRMLLILLENKNDLVQSVNTFFCLYIISPGEDILPSCRLLQEHYQNKENLDENKLVCWPILLLLLHSIVFILIYFSIKSIQCLNGFKLN